MYRLVRGGTILFIYLFFYSKTSQEEIDTICQGVLENLYAPEKSAECMNQLRQLYFILQASHTEPW